jgi:hypothetical protein
VDEDSNDGDSNNYNGDNNRNNCYDEGFSDGEDGPLSQNQHKDCGRPYYTGFIDGCLSVESNTSTMLILILDKSPSSFTSKQKRFIY